ncbi:hypothetical protein LPJ56_000034 [Coemansia sp. RSA 2599]|nr:hypothetical protein LPJ56_000034 [Coemansia sp. RSA 2599]
MQRSPYTRDTTDISDQELRQILDSENISGLPAPYCLVPHYDAQLPVSQNQMWPQPPPSSQLIHHQHQQQQQQQQQHSSAPAISVSQHSSDRIAAVEHLAFQYQSSPLHHQQRHQQSAVHGSSSSQSSAGGHDTASSQPATVSASAAAQVSGTPTTGDISRRRTRTTLTPYQLRVLFRVWERTQYPSSDLRSRLASNLMMTPRNVQIWFQNQRQKTKERAEMRRRTHSPSLHATALANAGMPPHPHQHHGQRQQISPAYLHHHHHHQALGSSPVHPTELGGREVHVGAFSMPGHSPPESPFRYAHGPPPAPPAVQPPLHHHGYPATLTSSTGGAAPGPSAPTVSGAYSMLTPPALYPPVFSQQQQQQQPLSTGSPSLQPASSSYSQHQHQHQQPPASSHLPKSMHPPNTPRHPHYHLQHHRHSSQPHNAEHLNPQSSISAHAPYASSSLQKGSAAPRIAEATSGRRQAPRMPMSQPYASSLNVHHNIPSPATPMSHADQLRHQQTPSPLASRQQNFTPPLLSSMSTLTMASSAATAADPATAASMTPQTLREQQANRRPQLVNILNPIGTVQSGDTKDNGSGKDGSSSCILDSKNHSGIGSSQMGPLPSLGSVLANVQSESRSDSPAAPPVSAANEATAAATAAEKWRPW